MPDVFLSYNREDQATARRFAEAFQAEGLDVWWDTTLRAGEAYDEVTEAALNEAKAVVVLWSPRSVVSRWVRAEATQADRNKTLVPVTIEPCKRPIMFELTQTADLSGWDGTAAHGAWQAFLADVRRFVGARDGETQAATSQAQPPRAATSERRLAVLAFENLSPDPEMGFFSDGVSEEILETVSRNSDLKVIGRASSFQFRGADKATRHVAAALGVTHVLDGSVRRSGQRVRIAAQLVECASETRVWSERFDRGLDDVFALQDEIAEAVAGAMKTAFAPARATLRVDPAIYELFLRAKDQGLGAQNVGLELAQRVRALEDVVAAAPEFAPGWAWLGQMRALMARRAERGAPFKSFRAAALEALDRAIDLDPRLPAPYIALNQLEPQGAFAARWRHVTNSLAVAPDHADSLTLAGHFAFTVGWTGDALAYGRRAYELDPLHPLAAQGYASAVWSCGDVAGARRLLLGFRDRRPEDVGLNLNLLNLATFNRDWAAFAEAETFARAHGHLSEPMLRMAVSFGRAVRSGDASYAARMVELVRSELGRTGTAPVQVLNVLCELGHGDEAFAAVERASFSQIFDEEGGSAAGDYNPGIIFNRASNWLMMSDPRFVLLCRRLGYVDFWSEVGRWPDCADHVPYDFRAEARKVAATS